MQGTAADIIKRAMIEVDSWLQQKKPAASLVMQVHDELVFEVREDQTQEVERAVVKRMAEAATLDVPLVVDTGHGPNWDTAH
jgi:DNA polymerase-1